MLIEAAQSSVRPAPGRPTMGGVFQRLTAQEGRP